MFQPGMLPVGMAAPEGVPPTAQAIALANVFRPDVLNVPAPCLSQEEALANGPSVEAGHFRVPRILEDGDPSGEEVAEE